jgi:hypothetical protein
MTWALLAVSLLGADTWHDSAAGCGKDTDCKGDRICENARCVDPKGLGEAKGGGSLSMVEVRRTIDGNMSTIQSCYEKALTHQPKLAGKVIFEWSIETDGSVGTVSNKSANLDRKLLDCLRGEIVTWHFKRPVGGRVVVTYPFTFKSQQRPMPIPWWKGAPTPSPDAKPEPRPERAGPGRPWSEGTPQGAHPAPTGFESNKIRCSADGCTFQGDASMTAALGPGMRPYCQHHATGGELKVADLIWRPPCACGRVADGFRQVVGGFSASHTADKCIERTLRAKPDDLTVPLGNPAELRAAEGTQVFHDRPCACGKRFDGVTNAVEGFVESHSARECIEQTKRAG